MKKLSLGLAVSIIACSAIPTSPAAGPAPAALKTFLEHEGYGGSSLQRRLGNHLFATAIINGRRMALAIDTGAPFTLVDSASARGIGLRVQQTKAHITGVTGLTERADAASI